MDETDDASFHAVFSDTVSPLLITSLYRMRTYTAWSNTFFGERCWPSFLWNQGALRFLETVLGETWQLQSPNRC